MFPVHGFAPVQPGAPVSALVHAREPVRASGHAPLFRFSSFRFSSFRFSSFCFSSFCFSWRVRIDIVMSGRVYRGVVVESFDDLFRRLFYHHDPVTGYIAHLLDNSRRPVNLDKIGRCIRPESEMHWTRAG